MTDANARGENAVLTLRSFQRSDDDTDSSELNTTAQYTYHPDRTEIVYREADEDGIPGGETTITVLGDSLVTIHKTGFIEATMILEAGKTHAVHYQTMLGTMEMQLSAITVTSRLNRNGGQLQLRYALDIGDSYSAVNNVDLRVTMRSCTGDS